KKIITRYVKDDMNSILQQDIRLVLPDDMLVKVDRMSMANSLEIRSPFIDPTIVEFVNKLPSHYKIDTRGRKKILKDAYKNELPQEIFNRPKHGFEVPLGTWLKGELKHEITSNWLNQDFIIQQNIFKPEKISTFVKKMDSTNPGDVFSRLWALVVFQYWYKKYMM
ncbi:MAG: asparagine synthase C-terminal domain-containing protein, partial [Bacteroidales bacterium]